MKKNKELKEAYKNMKFPMGVFQIRNISNGRLFIDSGTNMMAKWNRNRAQLNIGNHPNLELQTDWNTYGEKSFTFEILSELEYKDNEPHDYQKEIELLKEMIMDDIKPYKDKEYHKKQNG